MSESGWRALIAKEEYRPAIAAFTTAAVFCLWNVFFDPRWYVASLADSFAMTGNTVIDAELFRSFGNVLVIVLLVAIIRFVFQQSVAEYGLGLGRWYRAPIILICTPLLLLPAYVGSGQAAYQAHYPDTPGLTEEPFSVFLVHLALMATFYVAWELMFRGFLQSAMVPKLGAAGAIAVQTLASSLAHADRPDSELLGSVLIGAVWGILAYRTSSIWPSFMQHMLLGMSLDYFLCFS